MPKTPQTTHDLTTDELLTLTVAEIEQRARGHNPREVQKALPDFEPKVLAQATAQKRKYHFGRMFAAFFVLTICSVVLGVATMIRSTPGPVNASFNGESLRGLSWQQVEDKLHATQAAIQVPLKIDDQNVVLTQNEAGVEADSQAWANDIKSSDTRRRSRP